MKFSIIEDTVRGKVKIENVHILKKKKVTVTHEIQLPRNYKGAPL